MPVRRPLRRSYVVDHDDLISQPSYAPIAAVWMVIAMLGIAAYRMPTHAIVIDLPVPLIASAPAPLIDLKVDRVRLTAVGEILWNGEIVNYNELVEFAEASREEPVTPLLIFEPDANASYEFSAHVLAVLHATGLTRYRFCFGGIEQHRHFGGSLFGRSASPVFASASLQFSNPAPITDQAECDAASRMPST